MTYDKLMQSLDNLVVRDPYVITFEVLWGFLFLTTLIIFYACLHLIIRESKQLRMGDGSKVPFIKALPKKLKENEVALLLTTMVGVIALGGVFYFYNKGTYTLEDKQTYSSSKITDWEQGKDFKSYLKTLPVQKTEVTLIDSDSDSHTPSTSAVIVLGGSKQKVTVSLKDVYKVRKENLRKDEPKSTYLEYIVIPKKITYNYPKGKVIPLKLVQVW